MWCLRVVFLCCFFCLLVGFPLFSYGVDIGNQTAAPGAVIDFSTGKDLRIKTGVLVNLPTLPVQGSLYWITDAQNADDCTVGGGGLQSLCVYSGVSWLSIAQEGEIIRVNDLVTLSGRAANSTDMGIFTGSTISDNDVVKVALQELETAVETAHGTPTTFTVYTSDDCALVSGSVGDLCFEY